jgi:hypothetical protein
MRRPTGTRGSRRLPLLLLLLLLLLEHPGNSPLTSCQPGWNTARPLVGRRLQDR